MTPVRISDDQKRSGDARIWPDAALLLVGHGSARHREAAAPTLRLATLLAGQGRFAEVVPCFWHQAPKLDLNLTAAPLVFVVPHFAGVGVFTRRLIPEALGLAGRVSRIGGRTVIQTDPLGAHPRLPSLLSAKARSLCRQEGWDPADTALLLIGHGSSRGEESARTPEAVAAAIAGEACFAEVSALYLEQEPRLSDWPRRIGAKRIVAAPLLVSPGAHYSDDVPKAFNRRFLPEGCFEAAGRTVRLLAGAAQDEEAAAMLLDLVDEAAKSANDGAPEAMI